MQALRRLRQSMYQTAVGWRPVGAALKEADLLASRAARIDDLRTVCLAVGPYRNLSTLTATLLFLHPHCQVLNHAGRRIFGDPRVDFIAHPDDDTLAAFLRYAVRISANGCRGYYGGSMVHSHAFERSRTRRIYRRAGVRRRKKPAHALFWKEPLRTSNHIRDHHGPGEDLDALMRLRPPVKLLLPIRNPLDCARSNRRGHFKLFRQLGRTPSQQDIVEAIVDEIAWVARIGAAYPDRVFHFTQDDLTPDTLTRLARFLNLEAPPEWIDNATAAFRLGTGYQHPNELRAFYRERVESKLADHPDLARALLALA